MKVYNTYFYVRDALGNINHIIDQDGNLMVSYEYDEWGKLINTITTLNFALILSSVNPFIKDIIMMLKLTSFL